MLAPTELPEPVAGLTKEPAYRVKVSLERQTWTRSAAKCRCSRT
jgi:hypothetical protein